MTHPNTTETFRIIFHATMFDGAVTQFTVTPVYTLTAARKRRTEATKDLLKSFALVEARIQRAAVWEDVD